MASCLLLFVPTFPSVSPTYKVCDSVTLLFFVSFHFCLNKKVRLFYGLSIPSVLFEPFWRNDGIDTNAVMRSTIRCMCERLALAKIHCFCVSEATRDPQQE